MSLQTPGDTNKEFFASKKIVILKKNKTIVIQLSRNTVTKATKYCCSIT